MQLTGYAVQVQQIKKISAPPLVPPRALAGKTRLPTFTRQSQSSTRTEEPSRVNERYLGYEEPVHHIAWEGMLFQELVRDTNELTVRYPKLHRTIDDMAQQAHQFQ